MHVHSSILHNSTCIYVLHVLYVHTDCIVLYTCTHIQLHIVHAGEQYSGFYLSQIFGEPLHLHNVRMYVRMYTRTHAASMHVYLMINIKKHSCMQYVHVCKHIMYLCILRTYIYYVLIHTYCVPTVYTYIRILRMYLYILCTYTYCVPIHIVYLCIHTYILCTVRIHE